MTALLAVLFGLVPAFAQENGEDTEDNSERFVKLLESSGELRYKGDLTAAKVELDKARELTDCCPFAKEDLQIEESWILLQEGDLAKADDLLTGLRLPEDAPTWLRSSHLSAQSLLAYRLGHYTRARRAYLELVEIDRQLDDARFEASDLYNLAITHLAEHADAQTAQRALPILHEALRVAEQSNPDVLPEIHLELGSLTSGESGQAHFERCLEIASTDEERIDCLGGLAMHYLASAPDTSRELIARALKLARQQLAAGNPWPTLQIWPAHLPILWATYPERRALAESLDLLPQIEALRQLQLTRQRRAAFFAVWTDVYQWLAGRLLVGDLDLDQLDRTKLEAPNREQLDLAFLVAERYRARVLFDSLAAAGVDVPNGTNDDRPSDVEEDTPDTPSAPAPRRDNPPTVDELRERLSRPGADFPALRGAHFASLDQIETSLAANEALFAFQVSEWRNVYGDFGGGAWLLSVTRGASRAYPLPGRLELDPRILDYLALFASRDDSERQAAARLYGELLDEALRALPRTIDTLILVPDGNLHMLPFGSLRATPEAPPLADRYQISSVPSATLWQRWRSTPPRARRAALVMADPKLSETEATSISPPLQPQGSRARLEPLPYARAEGRAVIESMAGESVLLVGHQATEQEIKRRDLGSLGVLHFAAHAVVDTLHPSRSSIRLAAGGGEDGALEVKEIVDLELDGQIVVLSACSSARGPVLRGEGVMSLARAFFQAGATTVVASLWPLDDSEANLVFTELYRQLALGHSVQEALRRTQTGYRDKLAATAWAGLVVLGDGSRVPLPLRRWWESPAAWASWSLALLLLVISAVYMLGRQQTPRRSTAA